MTLTMAAKNKWARAAANVGVKRSAPGPKGRDRRDSTSYGVGVRRGQDVHSHEG